MSPTKDQKVRAEKLHKKFGKPRGKDSITGKFIAHENKIREKLTEWASKQNESISLAVGYYSRDRNIIKDVIEGMSLEEIRTKNKNPDLQIDDAMDEAEKRINLAYEFMDYKSEWYLKHNLDGLICYAYFLYYPSGRNHEALLGCANLSVGKNNIAEFKNTGLTGSVNYQGPAQPYLDMDHGIIIFDLESDKHGRKLHIKAFCEEKEQQVMLAMFTTYEDNRVQSGTILLFNPNAKVDGDTKTLKLLEEMTRDISGVPGCYNFLSKSDEFKKIPPVIRDFFRLRNNNYHRVFKEVDTLLKLEEKINAYEPHEHKNTWFLEKEKPEIFIASPILGSPNDNDSLFKTIVDDLNNEPNFAERLYINYSDKDSGYNKDGGMEPIKNLEYLKSVRVFILFLEEMQQASFSLVQLGWALSYSKQVILVYKKDCISERILALDKHILFPVEFTGKLTPELWRKKLKSKVAEEIRKSCKKLLD